MIEPILITGASRGLGLHLANKFEEEGYPVFKHNGRDHFDLTSQKQLLELAEEAKSNCPISGVLNCDINLKSITL